MGSRGRRRRIDRALVKELYEQTGNMTEVTRRLNARGIPCVYGTIRNILNGREYGKNNGTRFAETPVTGRTAHMPPIDNPAFAEKRTLYPSTVIRDLTGHVLLKSGHHQKKIGAVIQKGEWKGMPVFCLTLEERATCPVSCRVYRSCYGNNMNFAHRQSHEAPGFADALVRELWQLQRTYPGGYVVRLHILGDFYSVAYVRLWERALEEFPALRVYGYTARDPERDPIGRQLAALVSRDWDRFAVRFSNGPVDADGRPATITIEHPLQKPEDAVICPVQLGQTASCSTCAFCWGSRKRVAFIQH